MNVFGIGPMEIIFILLLAILIFGPKDIGNASKTVGRSLNKLVKSDTWRTVNQASNRIKNLPNELMREAGLEDLQKEMNQNIKQSLGPVQAVPPQPTGVEPTAVIPPPAAAPVSNAPTEAEHPTKETDR